MSWEGLGWLGPECLVTLCTKKVGQKCPLSFCPVRIRREWLFSQLTREWLQLEEERDTEYIYGGGMILRVGSNLVINFSQG